ncbi:MAG: AraC family transcriptional regulator [Porticoccaceae bacterium]|uniref:AraC family transcriptional regulator n=1 Tax=Thalassospira sp. TaxID=1912094 RepID=UPI003A88C022
MNINASVQEKTGSTGGFTQSALASRIAKWTTGVNAVSDLVPGLTLHRWETPTEQTSYMLAPSICLIGQGRKRVMLGEDIFEYDAHRFLITSIDLPVVSNIIEATPDQPYLGLTLDLDIRSMAQMILNTEMPSPRPLSDRRGIAVSQVTDPLLDAFKRLLDLIDSPNDVAALTPLIKQEILYRLLMGEQGPRLRQITSSESHSYQIAKAIDWLKNNFQQPCKVEDLAKRAGLSSSAFHNHFRNMTAMSPLQFQKRMRLNEARRLMLIERMDAGSAAFEVGYESPSQFSREYARHFGMPPARDIKGLQKAG